MTNEEWKIVPSSVCAKSIADVAVGILSAMSPETSVTLHSPLSGSEISSEALPLDPVRMQFPSCPCIEVVVTFSPTRLDFMYDTLHDPLILRRMHWTLAGRLSESSELHEGVPEGTRTARKAVSFLDSRLTRIWEKTGSAEDGDSAVTHLSRNHPTLDGSALPWMINGPS